jgi:hypothetical protein
MHRAKMRMMVQGGRIGRSFAAAASDGTVVGKRGNDCGSTHSLVGLRGQDKKQRAVSSFIGDTMG